jgi:ferredoxin
MGKDIYRKVQEQLDQYSIGFPATESGVEIEILKLLFTEEEATLFSQMTGEPETPASVAERIGRPVDEVTDALEKMALKGLLYRDRRGESIKYSAIPFIHGLLEFQALWMPKDLVWLTGKYIREKLKDNMAGDGGGGMRVLPVEESVDVKHTVASYDDAYEILKKEELLAVTDCSCRLQRKQFDRACDTVMEACIMVGPMAQYYLDNKMGRRISVDDAMEIIKESHEAGLVTQTQSITRPFMICNCCKCCCGFLGAVRRTSNPAQLVTSNHIAVVDAGTCSGCEACIEKCQVNALKMNDENIAEIDYDRCIGCGLCAPACPDDALSLVPKPAEDRHIPTENLHQQMTRLRKRRGAEHVDRKQIVSYGFE